jgi:hypothetical protein
MYANFGGARWGWALLLIALLAVSASGQQTNVTRFDLFTGYTYLDSPHVSLAEHGFHTQIGVRPWTWMSLGFDYSGRQEISPSRPTSCCLGCSRAWGRSWGSSRRSGGCRPAIR